MDIQAKCQECGKISVVMGIEEDAWLRYLEGDLVQNVWPELSDDEREVLMGNRVGFYTCSKCWDEFFSEED